MNPSQHNKVISQTATNIIGPAFLFFTWWTLKKAQALNFKRLYFLSRDGQIFYKIAQIIQQKYPLGIETRYLYGSRHMWLLSALSKISQYEQRWIFSDWWFFLTVNSVCKRVAIKPEAIETELAQYGFTRNLWNQPLSSSQKDALKLCLCNQKTQTIIIQNLQTHFQATLEYLKQEGLADTTPWAIVDIGWRGKPQVALHKTLSRGGILPPKGITGFYFGITEGAEICPHDRMFGFLFDLSRSLRHFDLRNNHLLEAFASSDEGKLLGFAQHGSHWKPVVDKESSQVLKDWGIGRQQEAILSFAREFVQSSRLDQLAEEEMFTAIKRSYGRFLNSPTENEADTYGSFPLDGEMTQIEVNQIAPVVTRGKAWRACLDIKNFKLFWIQACLVRSKLYFETYVWKFFLPILEVCFYSLNIAIYALRRRFNV